MSLLSPRPSGGAAVVSVPLRRAIPRLLELLRRVHAHPCLYVHRPTLEAAVDRYERIWLPLLAGLSPTAARRIAPPLDVGWVWLVHLLSPVAYAADVGVLPQYRSRRFIAAAIARYTRHFLPLKAAHPTTPLVPTYDIDLAWHAHMAHPAAYRDDTARLLRAAGTTYGATGSDTAAVAAVIPHNDGLNGRAQGSALEAAWNATRSSWEAAYGVGVPLTVPGTSWRGNRSSVERRLAPALASDLTALAPAWHQAAFLHGRALCREVSRSDGAASAFERWSHVLPGERVSAERGAQPLEEEEERGGGLVMPLLVGHTVVSLLTFRRGSETIATWDAFIEVRRPPLPACCLRRGACN
ncbi:hypothetical protein I4F81_005415 [Pyropia yezoensis]|uniref:Uncharacterized protein n=1 Tax=Pyropia yezoensis TaxID=2788 RepID=A0ACC3BZ58_PYRYE|nr:hypothetical protein I4F81_005415 [Neopyropia yezoensis]